MKLVILLLLGCWLVRHFSGAWPWELWVRSERSRAEAQARNLLGLGREASREEIAQAHRRVLAVVHPDRGGSADKVHAATAARDILLARINRTQAPIEDQDR